jgi:capsule biosynthesis phosphatase
MSRICLDLDGVIAELKKPGQTYRELSPVPGAVEKVQALKAEGHYLIIQTARHMKTCGANVGLVNARIAKDTLDWLEAHQVPFDGIYFVNHVRISISMTTDFVLRIMTPLRPTGRICRTIENRSLVQAEMCNLASFHR